MREIEREGRGEREREKEKKNREIETLLVLASVFSRDKKVRSERYRNRTNQREARAISPLFTLILPH